jgi:predicted Zn-dependent protease
MYPLSMPHTYLAIITLSLFLAGCQSTSTSTTHSSPKASTSKSSPTSNGKVSEKSTPVSSKKTKPKAPDTTRKSDTKTDAKSDTQVDSSPASPVVSSYPQPPQPIETITPLVVNNPPIRKHLPSQVIFEDLIMRADQARKQKQWAEAAALYQQAQRLKPKRTVSYARLSEFSLAQGHPAQAETYARQGLHLAKSHSQKRGFWALIALSLEKQGKSVEAAQARAEIAKLR